MLGGPTSSLSLLQVLVPTRVGQVYVYDSPKGEQDEYDFPRHLLSTGSQEIYDVPPVRGGVPSQFSQEVRLVRGRGVLCHSMGFKSGQMALKAVHVMSLGTVLGTSILPSGPWEEVGAHTIPDTQSCVPSFQVYDTPPMAVKGPNGQDPGQEIYDVPPSVEKSLHQTVSAAEDIPAALNKTLYKGTVIPWNNIPRGLLASLAL